MKKKMLTIILVAVVIAAGMGYFVWESGSYVAKVGKEKIKNHEYTFFLRVQKSTTEGEANVTEEQEIKELWQNPVDGEDPVTLVMNQALENAKEFKIQLIKANRDRYKLSDQEKKEVQEYLNYLMKDSEYVSYVKENFGLQPAQFKDMMLKSQLVESYSYNFMQNNRDRVSVSDEEVKEYYDDNKESIDDVTVRHLLISTNTEGMTEEEKQEKRKLAEELLQRIKAGETMVDLIPEYSEDPGHVQNGGAYTFTYTQSLVQGYAPEFSDWAFQANVGDIDIVETDLGYHIMQLESKKTYEDKIELVRSNIKLQKLNDYYNESLEEWKKDPAFNLVKNENVLNKITRSNFP